jgi:hypothetical protein
MTIVFENPANGYRVEVDSFAAWLWTTIFGPFFLLFRGNTLHFFLWWLFALTGVGGFIYPFFAASILRRMYYERGYRAIEQRPTSLKVPLIVGVLFVSFIALLILLISGGPSSTSVHSQAAVPRQQYSRPPSPLTDGNDSLQIGSAPVTTAAPVTQNTEPATLQPSAAQSPPETLYFVQGIASGDTLNVRTGPGANFPISVRLPSSFDNIRIVGASVMNDTTEWVPITFGDQSGWVARRYLQPQ